MSTMNQNARALKIMERIQAKTGLTENGKIALIQLINPFTDFSMPRAGFYDSDESSSVIQCVKYSKVITAPAGTAGNWDCHVFNTPLTNTHSIVQQGNAFAGSGVVVNFANNIAGSANDTGPNGLSSIGPVVCISGPSGADLSLCLRVGASTVCTASGLGPDLDSPYVQGVSRLIGMGFEIHNTTAEIYKQGSVAVYRSPQTHLLDRQCRNFLTAQGATKTAPTLLNEGCPNQFYTYNDVPGTLGAVLALDGSRQWEAKDGAMCVPTLVDGSIPVSRFANVVPICINRQFPITITTPSSNGGSVQVSPACLPGYSNLWVANVSSTQNTEVCQIFADQKTNQFNTTGAFFTGLSNNTSLVVNTIYYFERFPTPQEADLVVMAYPSPSEDRMARELYSLIMREMPVACKVGDNADGDWFFEGLSSVLKFIDPVIKTLPMGGVLAPAARAVSNWADNKVIERNSSVAPGHTWTDKPLARVNPGKEWENASGMVAERKKKKKKKKKAAQKVPTTKRKG